MPTNKRFPLWKLLLIPAILVLLGCPPRGYYVLRSYKGKMYRQYYERSSEARYLTLTVGEDGKWRGTDETRRLADDIQAKGTFISQSGPVTLPSGQLASTGDGFRQAAAAVTRRLYIVSSAAKDEMVTVEPDAGTILVRTELPRPNPFELASLPDDSRIFVIHQAQQAVGSIPATPPGITVFEKDTSRITMNRTLPAGIIPNGKARSLVLAVTPGGKRLYLANNGEASVTPGNISFPKSTIEVFNPDTLATVASIPTPQAGIPFNEIVASPDGTLLFATTGTRIIVIDTLTNTVSTQVITGGDALVFHPDGTKVYFSRRTSIGIIDTATATVAGEIPVPGAVRIQQLVITPDGVDLFGQDDRAGKLFLIDVGENRVAGSFTSIGANLLSLAQ